MRIIVREAVLEDAPLIANLTRKAWAGKCPPTSRGHRDTWVNVNEDLHAGGAFILLVDDIPAGSLRWAPLDEDENVWKIRRLGVIPAFCGQNLSQHLIEAVIHHAQPAFAFVVRGVFAGVPGVFPHRGGPLRAAFRPG